MRNRVHLLSVLFLVMLFFIGPISDGAETVYFDRDFGSAYKEILAGDEALLDFQLKETNHSTVEFFADSDTMAAEMYDFQADILKSGGDMYRWYPHYTAAVVLAVRNDCDKPISGWQSLRDQPVTVSFPADSPRLEMAVMAASYGLTGGLKREEGLRFLERLVKEERLRTDTTLSGISFLHKQEKEEADVYISTDVQVRLWQEQGMAVHIVVPTEGTLAFRRGLLAKRPLGLDGERIERELLLSRYRLQPGGHMYLVQDSATFADDMEPLSDMVQASVLGIHAMQSFLGVPHLVRYCGFLFFLILWEASLSRRLYEPAMRKWVLALLFVSVGWVLVRLAKLMAPSDAETTIRYLWYGYYVFMAAMSFLFAYMGGLASGISRVKRGALYALAGLSVLHALLVLTNDLHHQVFQFPLGLSAAESVHTYEIGYWAFLLFCAFEFLLANIWIYSSAWKSHLLRAKQLWPQVVTILFTAYIAGYNAGAFWISYTELVFISIGGAFLWLELLLDTQLIPSNRKYRDFFTHANLGMEIRNKKGDTVFTSRWLPESGSTEQVMPIKGGHVIWHRNDRELREQKRKLSLAADTLARAYELAKKDEEIQRDYIRMQVEKKIYKELEEILASKGYLLEKYTKFLKTAPPGNAADIAVSRLNVIAAYIKKRCVMLLKGRENQSLDPRELRLSIEELFRYLEKIGLKGILSFDLEEPMAVEKALSLYDFFEQFIEAAVLGEETHMVCQVEKKEDAFVLRALVDHRIWVLSFMQDIRKDSRFQDPSIRLALEDLDYAYSVQVWCRER